MPKVLPILSWYNALYFPGPIILKLCRHNRLRPTTQFQTTTILYILISSVKKFGNNEEQKKHFDIA